MNKNPREPGPHIIEVQARTYAWCACGESQKQPFCDGSHGSTGMHPIIVQIPEKKTITWCGCKLSNNKPYCDGTHKKLQQSDDK